MAQPLCEDKSRDMGFCFSDVSSNNTTINIQPHLMNMNHIQQGFVTDPAEMFNLTTGMEMIGFPKNLQQQQQNETDINGASAIMWKGNFFGKPSQHATGPSSSKTIMNQSSSNFYNYNSKVQDFTSGISETSSDNNLMVGGEAHDISAPWHHENRLIVDDSPLRCVFPCEGNERPSQGLSLSLSSTHPSSIGLQSFELRQTSTHHHPDFVSPREEFFGKSTNGQQVLQDGYLSGNNKVADIYQGHFLVKNSKFLVPAQDLLNEFCSLGTKENDVPKQKYKQWEEQNNNASKNHSLTSLEFVELQKRKTKLLSVLEEVDRRYKHYCNQMKGVVSSFEAVAGNGAATVYSALALKAMSRHFRCLKDGIMDQIEATRKAMGEKDPVAPGTTKGETPRLRIIDQTLRQQRVFQQINMMETHPWRPQRGLPERSVSVLRAWLFEHFLHPYPSDVDKHILARQTGLSRSQVSNWFINARVRLWKPMVEEMYMEEEKEEQGNSKVTPSEDHQNGSPNSTRPDEDQKPKLLRIDSECVSSIVNKKNEEELETTAFGSVELDFSSYTHGGSGVSLTLGLQQHDDDEGSGVRVSLAFPAAATTQSSMFEPVHVHHQYSLLDAQQQQQGQNMPYRNLMGTHLLHHLPS